MAGFAIGDGNEDKGFAVPNSLSAGEPKPRTRPEAETLPCESRETPGSRGGLLGALAMSGLLLVLAHGLTTGSGASGVALHSLQRWSATWLLLVTEVFSTGSSSPGIGSTKVPSTATDSDTQPVPWKYEVIMDAGSSGTRVHVYQYVIPDGSVLPVVQHPEATMKTEPGLSSLRPEQVKDHLQPLLEFSAEHIPADDHADTPIVLLATAGLRLLPENHAESLLGAAREVLAETGFRSSPEWTGMLSGQDEGLYSWLAASYGSGMLHKRLEDSGMDADSSPGVAGWETTGDADSSSAAGAPVGLVELGGASAQVTFEHHAVGGCIVHVNGELLGSLKLPGIENSLVTNSFLGFGLDVAQEQVAQLVRKHRPSKTGSGPDGALPADAQVSDPCMPVGWEDATGAVVGTGRFSGCLELAQKVMQGACEDHTCTISGMHKPNANSGIEEEGVTLPRFRGKILAIENFFYTRSVLALPQDPTLAEVEEAGERYCSTPWDELISNYVETGIVRNERDLLKYCFSAAYIVVFLHNGLGVGRNERRVHFTNSVTDLQGQEVAVRWALGALVMRAAQRSSQAGQKNSSLLEHTRQQLQRLLAAGGWGDKHVLGQQVESVAPAKQLQSAKGHEDGEDSEEVAVVFTCGPEFCCATASIP